jgi:hypothetical protein
MNAAQAVAAGIHALPGVGRAFATTQAAWRFWANPRVTLPVLIEPLREAGRRAAAESPSRYVLLDHDWSKVDYASHKSKPDLTQLSNHLDHGYELSSVLAVDAHDGAPLAPMGIRLYAADGDHTSESTSVEPHQPHLDQLLPWMQKCGSWGLDRIPVHIIDREGDSLKHMRAWDADGHKFVVRADDRRVTFRGQSRLFSEITATLQQENAFAFAREVDLRGRRGRQFVAEAEVVLAGPAWARTPDGKKYTIPGPPLRLRLVVAQVRDDDGALLAEWWLLTNVDDVPADQIALWYYWRWRIESFYKLLKSAGLELEEWRQESAAAIAKRLLVACMTCVTAWRIERLDSPEAEECKQFLVRVSGRQTKRRRPITTPALVVGLHLLLSTLEILDHYSLAQLRQFAALAMPIFRPSG